MLTASFIWLIISHIAVIYPVLITLKNNRRRWLPGIIVLIFSAIISSIYHWYNKEGFSKNELILNRNFKFYATTDYFASYLSVFIIVFYTINPRQKPEHLDIFLVLIVISCQIFSLLNAIWYIFLIYVTLFCLLYISICKKTDWRLTINNIINYPKILLLAILFFLIAMTMQYYLCKIYGAGFYYNLYHGFWHLFMFLSAGTLIYWNEKIRSNLVRNDI